MSIKVGEVIAVIGTKVVLRIDEDSNKETLFLKGEKYKGVSIREYLSIQRGFREIICVVEGEYLDESRVDTAGGKAEFIRKVEVRPIGHFDQNDFQQGIKYMPMIRDPAFLMPEKRIASIFDRAGDSGQLRIGRMLKEEIVVSLPWTRLFNSHIGIFGNTGSGKSNTLAKLYTVLFDQKMTAMQGKSRFIILDFNGEYVGDQLTTADNKKVYLLSTGSPQQAAAPIPNSRFPLRPEEFWDLETLSLLFQATTNTQRPFLNRVIEGRKKYEHNQESLTTYTKRKFRDAFCASAVNTATLDLMRSVARLLNNPEVGAILQATTWMSKQQRFWWNGNFIDPNGEAYDAHLAQIINTLDASGLDHFDQLVLRVHLQLIGDLVGGYVQFEHIQPILKRVESSLSGLKNVLQIGANQGEEKLLTVISLRRCKNEIKKVLPLLFAKHYYIDHKNNVETPPNKTIHLIIDEAHNILSEQSNRESESWKDYRLEQFEEIIKEGRKFGVFITLASQRPADISPTLVSQLHNFFIHRLVNDRDLFLIDNTITTLDALSRGLIPGLAQGCCVVTGTAFDLPIVLQIDRLPRAKQPASEDVNLGELWE